MRTALQSTRVKLVGAEPIRIRISPCKVFVEVWWNVTLCRMTNASLLGNPDGKIPTIRT